MISGQVGNDTRAEEGDRKRLTFSFDNGPSPDATDKLLDFLAGRGISASFFVIGERLRDKAARRLAERARAEGHWIGNHTLSHGVPLGIDGNAGRVEREIGEAQRLIGPLAHPLKYFRPNGGGVLGPHILSHEAREYLKGYGFTLVTWTCAPGDWISPHEQWLDRAVAHLDEEDWPLIVLHDEHIASMLDLLHRFCDDLERRRVEITQAFPPQCLPIVSGTVSTGDPLL